MLVIWQLNNPPQKYKLKRGVLNSFASVAQLVEHCADNAVVAGSNPAICTNLINARLAQLVEQSLYTAWVMGSNPIPCTKNQRVYYDFAYNY